MPRHFSTHCLAHTMSQQDRQCSYNITMRRIRATIVAVENQ